MDSTCRWTGTSPTHKATSTGPIRAKNCTSTGTTSRRETALSFYGRRLYELMSAYWPTADNTPDATPLILDFAHIWRHSQVRVLAYPGVRLLEVPPGTRRPGRGGNEAESRNRRQAGGGRRDAGRTDRAGRTGGVLPAEGS